MKKLITLFVCLLFATTVLVAGVSPRKRSRPNPLPRWPSPLSQRRRLRKLSQLRLSLQRLPLKRSNLLGEFLLRMISENLHFGKYIREEGRAIVGPLSSHIL